MRKFLIAVAILAGVLFLIGNQGELEAVWETLRRGSWAVLGLALLAQAIWFLSVAATYRAVYRALGLEERILRLGLAAAAATFLNVVAPSGGMTGIAVFIAEARRGGYSAIRATLAGILVVLFDYAAFICVLVLGLAVLFRRNNLNGPELAAAGVLIVVAMVKTSLLVLGMRSAEALGNVLARLARAVNRVIRPVLRRDYLSEERGREFARDLAEGLQALKEQARGNPDKLLWPLALALSNKALLMTVFFLMFVAFQVPFSTGTIVAGFTMAILFTIVSPTPAGIGIVEGVLTVALRSLGVPLGSAAVITLAYRGFTFWLPLLFGMAALRILEHFPAKPVQLDS